MRGFLAPPGMTASISTLAHALVLGGGLLDVVDDQDGVGALGLFHFEA